MTFYLSPYRVSGKTTTESVHYLARYSTPEWSPRIFFPRTLNQINTTGKNSEYSDQMSRNVAIEDSEKDS